MICLSCSSPFEIHQEDKEFYKRFETPEPNICPLCRRQRLMAWRNERTFYNRTCAWCKAPMISCFSQNAPFTVLCSKCWWGDSFDPLKYGRDFDFNRPFFDQFWEQMQSVPIGNLFIASSENSDYSNYAVGNKNCYMVTASDYNEDSFYADNSNKNRDVGDISFVNGSELLYECIDTMNSYHCVASQNLKNCNFCIASFDLIGCSNCIGCVGLRNAEYYILNKKYSREAYQVAKDAMQLSSYSGWIKLLESFQKFQLTQPRRMDNNLNAENSLGNYIVNSKDCLFSFDMQESEHCRYSVFGYKTRNAYDIYGAPECELAYQVAGATTSFNIQFCSLVWPGSSDIFYSLLTRMGKNCLGSVSLHKNQYCIFNKQYSKEDYDKLFRQIKNHMIKTGEWGNFFPMVYSPWSYNETVAYDYEPLLKEEVLKLGARWEDHLPGTFGKETISMMVLSDDIRSVPTFFVEEILACFDCGRNYRIIVQELTFYKKLGVPLPRHCPSCRYKKRLALRNPRKLWKRPCLKCHREFPTTYASHRPEKLYCETCYQSF